MSNFKTTFEDFLNEYRENFNAEEAIKSIFDKAYDGENYNKKEMINDLYSLTSSKTLPSAIKDFVKKYPELEGFENELTAILEEE